MPYPSVERPASALRLRMLEDMAMRGLCESTQRDYIRFVRAFAAFLGRSPDTASAEDVRRFQVHQSETGVQAPTINGSVSALRFLFTVTLDRPDLGRRLVLTRYQRKLPTVLSAEEVGRLLEAAPSAKYRAALGTAYGAGLRVSEVASLKIDDIDSTRMLIRIEEGKGRKDRNAMLSPQLLELLRLWWREGRRRGVMLPHGWLFPGRSRLDPMSTRQLNRAVHEAAEAAGITKCVSPHTLRRAIAVRRPPAGLIHHADRGSQYCARDYQAELRRHGLRISTSGRGNCFDNAMVETFFKALKAELVWRTVFQSRAEATAAIGRYIDGFYNPVRRHSALNFISPLQFERRVA